jgi:surfeit locus 1 family protein
LEKQRSPGRPGYFFNLIHKQISDVKHAKTLLLALFSRRWWWVTLLVMVLMIGLARLGVWQLDRLAERREANAALTEALNAPAIILNDELEELMVYQPEESPKSLANRNAVVTGEFDFDHQIVLRLQPWQGRTGYRLVTPLVIDQSSDNGERIAILVDHGWIPQDAYNSDYRIYEETDGVGSVEGYIALTETLMRQASGLPEITDSGIEVYRVDLAVIQPVVPYQLMPVFLRENPRPNEEGDSLPVRIPREIDLSEGPHLGYAIQWFIFSLGLGIGYILFVNYSLDKKNTGDPSG